MHLTPHEQERLLVHVAADVARRRRERKLPLNYPEVVALLTAHVYEQARAGETVDSIMESGRSLLTRDEVMEGVPEMIDVVQVEATFPDGTKLVSIHDPFEKLADSKVEVYPGKIELLTKQDERDDDCETHTEASAVDEDYDVPFNKGEPNTLIHVKNESDRPVQVGSHFHFYEVNEGYLPEGETTPEKGLVFDRSLAYGMRLNIASGTSERFEPGEERCVALVRIKGDRKVKGLQGQTNLKGQRIKGDDGELTTPPADPASISTNGTGDEGRTRG